jgi:hypothetical protein
MSQRPLRTTLCCLYVAIAISTAESTRGIGQCSDSDGSDPAGAKLLAEAAAAMKLTARGYHRVLKVVAPSPISRQANLSPACMSPRRGRTAASCMQDSRSASDEFSLVLLDLSKKRRTFIVRA